MDKIDTSTTIKDLPALTRMKDLWEILEMPTTMVNNLVYSGEIPSVLIRDEYWIPPEAVDAYLNDTPMPQSSDYLTVEDAAKILSVSCVTVRRFVHTGQLCGYRAGAALVIPRKAVDVYLQNNPVVKEKPVKPVKASSRNASASNTVAAKSNDDCVGIDEAAEMMNVSQATVLNRIKDGTFPATMVKHKYHIPKAAVEAYQSTHHEYDGWYSANEVAEMLGIHCTTVRDFIRSGKLSSVRVGKSYRVSQDAVDAYLVAEHKYDDCISVDEAAEMLGVNRQTVVNRIKSGEIPANMINHAYRIPKAAIEAYLVVQNTDDGCISVDEAAEMLNVSRNTVIQRIESGKLPATMVKHKYRIPKAAVEAYLVKPVEPDDGCVSVDEAAEMMNVTCMTVLNRIKDGTFPATMVKHKYRIPKAAVEAYLVKPVEPDDGCVSVDEAAEMMNVSYSNIHKYIKSGKLPAIMVKHKYRIPKAAIEAYLVKPVEPDDGCVSVDEAAEMMNVCRNTILKRIKSGKLPAIMVKRAYRIPKAAVEAYLVKSVEPDDDCISVDEAAEMMNVCPDTILNRIKSGEIPANMINHAYRIPKTAIEAYLAAQHEYDDCISVDEAAEMMNVSHSNILKRIKSGKLPAIMVKHKYRIPKAAVEAYPVKPVEPDDDWYSVDDVAEILNVSRATVLRRIKSGKLPATMVKHAYFIPSEAVESQPVKPAVEETTSEPIETPVSEPTVEQTDDYISVKEAAEMMNVTCMTVLNRIKDGTFPATRDKRAYRVSKSAVEAYLTEQRSDDEGHLSMNEVASRLGIGRESVRRRILSGEIKAVRVGQAFRIPKDAVDEYLANPNTYKNMDKRPSDGDLTILEMAGLLGVGRDTVRCLMLTGELPSYQLKNQYRIPRAAAAEYLLKTRLQKNG